MSGTDRSPNLEGQRSYFFLSYAHSPPLAGTLQADPDQWVRTFYRDLTESVDHLASKPRLAPGFLDQDIPPGASWKASLTRALSAAEVFVPLLSPGYFARSWPGREWACFSRRLSLAQVAEPDRRFMPVLWIPLQEQQDLSGRRDDALTLGAATLGAASSGYAENGLRTMLRLAPYRSSYHQIVQRLAADIVHLAENEPLPPSQAPDISEVQSAFPRDANGVVFAVTVAAPSRTDLPAGCDRVGYGDRDVDWLAYPDDQTLPLAEYAAQVAEQLDFAVIVAGVEKTGDLSSTMPGVILIDPWFAASDRGLSALRSLASKLPHWVLPLLVLDPLAGPRATELAALVRAVLGDAAATHTETARLAMTGVTTLKEFISVMPILVAEAERQYLRRGPVHRSIARPGSRLRLAGDGRPVTSAQHFEEKEA
jgi:FxsC-like protein